MDKDKIVLQLEDGTTKEFYKLAEFRSNKTFKNYIMFTDMQYNNGNLNVYFNIVTEVNGKIKLDKIVNQVDMDECNIALEEFKKMTEKKE